MNRRQFCRSLSLLALAPALLPRGSWAALPASPQLVDNLHRQLDQLHQEFQQLQFTPFQMGLDDNLRGLASPEQLRQQRQWLSQALPRVQTLNISELPAEAEARLEAFHGDLKFLTEWNRLSTSHAREISPSRGFEAMSSEEKARIQRLYDQGASCVYLTQERWKGLPTLSQGQAWYDLYARYWTTLPGAEACQPLQLAEQSLARCQSQLVQLQAQLGLSDLRTFLQSPDLLIHDEQELLKSFARIDGQVRALQLFRLDCPPVQFQRLPEDNPTRAPGVYSRGVFYYDFQQPFPRYNLSWLYLHEALPGHHAQSCHSVVGRSRLLTYPGLMEGWAVYAEHLGAEHGLLDDPVQRLGWVLWDQVRSARVFLDWQIHRLGWTQGQAIDWWTAHLPLQAERASNEVARVMRWPGQSLSYKVGEQQLLNLRQQHRLRLGDRFEARAFHDLLLKTPHSSWHELFQVL